VNDRTMPPERGVDTGKLVAGLVLLTVGGIFLADRLYWIDARELFRLWPVWLIGFGVLRVLFPSRGRGRLGGFWPILIGGVFLLDTMRVLDLRDSWPLFIVGAGLFMVLRSASAGRRAVEPRS
jgi:hypothetical protein